ncbi:hypothetical protein ACFQ1S_38435, partial [Kibdelosporangium lantanae]
MTTTIPTPEPDDPFTGGKVLNFPPAATPDTDPGVNAVPAVVDGTVESVHDTARPRDQGAERPCGIRTGEQDQSSVASTPQASLPGEWFTVRKRRSALQFFVLTVALLVGGALVMGIGRQDTAVEGAYDGHGKVLIRGASMVLTEDATLGTLQNSDVLVDGDHIAAVGPNLPAA